MYFFSFSVAIVIFIHLNTVFSYKPHPACLRCKSWEKCVPNIVKCSKLPCVQTHKCISVGLCPPVRVKGNNCMGDIQCKGNQRCCSGNCLNPMYVPKPGMCPIEKLLPKVCRPIGCKNDMSCSGDLKCCGQCFRRCVKPQPRVKPGICPPSPRAPGICVVRCINDYSCKGDQKCCGSCPKVCKSPLRTQCKLKCKPWEKCVATPVICVSFPCLPRHRCISVGICPRVTVKGNKCTDDMQCTGKQRCCSGNCLNALYIPKPGRCPIIDLLPKIKCRPIGCKNDMSCSGDLKCCGLCSRRCVKPSPSVKPGNCPNSPRLPGICVKRCINDFSCKGNQKCCGICPRMCKSPVTSRCKRVCPRGFSCLPTYVICKKPPCFPVYKCISRQPKSGQCPSSFVRGTQICSYDRQCSGFQKCCGFICKNPKVVFRSGCCPAYPKILCRPVKQPLCLHDGHCRAPMKCCGSCPRRCMRPRNSKPGVCPVTRRLCINPLLRDQCRADCNCKGIAKCCRNECKKMTCQTPILIKGK